MIAVGQGAHLAAQMISQMRGFIFAEADTLAAVETIVAKESAATVVIVAEALSHSINDFLGCNERIAANHQGVAVSFIYGHNSDELGESAARFPIVAQNDQAPPQQIVLSHPDFTSFVAGARVWNANAHTSSTGDLEHIFEEPQELVYLLAHSNGLDTGVGKVALCSRKNSDDINFEDRLLPCFRGAPCRFLSSEFLETPIDVLRARRLVMLICWGVVLNDQVFSHRFTIGHHLMRNEVTEAMITLVRSAVIDEADFLILYYLINSGVRFGEAANKANYFRIRRGTSADIFCFGDPETRLSSAVHDLGVLESNDKWVCIDLPEDIVLPCDVTLTISTRVLPPSPVLLIEKSDDLTGGVLTPWGRVYLTVLAGRRFRAMLTSSTALAENASFVSQLLEDRAYFDIFRLAVWRLAAFEGQIVPAAECITAVTFLEDLLLRWPTTRMVPYSVISASSISLAMNTLMKGLERFGELFVELYKECAKFGWPPIKFTGAYFKGVGNEVASVCPYCHGTAYDQERKAIGTTSRILRTCVACGWIFEGKQNRNITVEFRRGEKVSSGELVQVRLVVRNPYPIAMPATAVVVLKEYHLKEAARMRTEVGRADPTASLDILLELSIPEFLEAGSYWIHGVLIVGFDIAYFRRPIIVVNRAGEADHVN